VCRAEPVVRILKIVSLGDAVFVLVSDRPAPVVAVLGSFMPPALSMDVQFGLWKFASKEFESQGKDSFVISGFSSTYTAQETATSTSVQAFAIFGGILEEVSGVCEGASADAPLVGSDPEHAARAVTSIVYTRPFMRESPAAAPAREPTYRLLRSRRRTLPPRFLTPPDLRPRRDLAPIPLPGSARRPTGAGKGAAHRQGLIAPANPRTLRSGRPARSRGA